MAFIGPEIAAFEEVAARLTLRLNPAEHEFKELTKAINGAQELILREGNDPSSEVSKRLDEFRTKILDISRALLKKEWNRVKKGEPNYVLTRNVAFFVCVLAVAGMVILIWLGR